MSKGRVVIPGATGMIGRLLCAELIADGYEVVVLSRDPEAARTKVPGAAAYAAWQPDGAVGDWPDHLVGARAVVYLAGEQLFQFGKRWTYAQVRAETNQRIGGIRQMVAAMAVATDGPTTLVGMSSVGIFGFVGLSDEVMTDDHVPASDTWGHDSAGLEAATLSAGARGIRAVVVRPGFVLDPSPKGGLGQQANQMRRGFGGWIAPGPQWTSWIHVTDVVGMIHFALEHDDVHGPLNAAAPEAVRTRAFAVQMGHVLGKRAWLRIPGFGVRQGLGVVAEILTNGKRMVPQAALAYGYPFRFPTLDPALRDLLGVPNPVLTLAPPVAPPPHFAYGAQKLSDHSGPTGALVEQIAEGHWRVRGLAEAEEILHLPQTKQAGFQAELYDGPLAQYRPPMLFLEGDAHLQQRRQTAKFFTPKRVNEDYRAQIEKQTEVLFAGLRGQQRFDLSALTLALAVQVAARIVGLDHGQSRGMQRRISAFLDNNPVKPAWRPRAIRNEVKIRRNIVAFLVLDVQPAIQSRMVATRDDIISHLLVHGFSDGEILTECIAFCAAGMATMREFLAVAAWHLLERPDLRARYLLAEQGERYGILHEILRLEPTIAQLARHVTDDITLTSGGVTHTIPTGARIDLDLTAANTDATVVGDAPHALVPDRAIPKERVGAMGLSFGDGIHRCAGEFVAMLEADIFLRHLLAIEGLHVIQPPTARWNDVAAGYLLRGFIVGTK